MGKLPPQRCEAGKTFRVVGVDYGGPITTRSGHTRKPVKLKTYICVFVCCGFKEEHLETVTHLTTDAFLAVLKHFTSKRGVPTKIHSDNDSSFIGANGELQHLYKFLSKNDIEEARSNFCT